MDCSLPGSSIHGILPARVLEWGAISFSWRSSQPRDRTRVSCTAGRLFTLGATREAHLNVCMPPLVWISFPYRPPQSREKSSTCYTVCSHSAQFSRSVVCNPMNRSTPGLRVHHLQLPESTQTYVHQVSDAIQPPHPLSSPSSFCLQSFPASESFQMSQLLTSGGQSIGVSASTSVLPMNTQD